MNLEYTNLLETYTNSSILVLPFLEKHKNNFNLVNLCQNSEIPEEFYEKNIKRVHWGFLAIHGTLSSKFIEKYKKYIRMENLCINHNLPVESIPKATFKNFQSLLYNPCVPTNTIKEILVEYYEYIHWDAVQRNVERGDEFWEEMLDKYEEKIDWYWLAQNQSLSENFWIKRLDKLEDKIHYFHRNCNFSAEFWRKHKSYLMDYEHLRNAVIKNSNLPLDFYQELIDSFKERICWFSMSYNPNIPFSLLEENREKYNLPYYYMDFHAEVGELQEKYRPQNIWLNKNMTLDFFLKYSSTCHYGYLGINQGFFKNLSKQEMKRIFKL